jgi:thiol-disulfide isomerase/thioredoxin
MLAMSLAGSALDVLLQPNVGQYVQAQASQVRDLGTTSLGPVRTRCFQVDWAGAKVELWFAAEGDPLLVQFTRTTCVPTGDDTCYEMVHTARFTWQLNARLSQNTFTIGLPAGACRVNDIYDALSGDDPATRLGKPLPKIELSHLDGSTINVAAPADKRGLVLIFWATWCANSIEDMAAVSQFVAAYSQKGIAFYAVNVGEQPGDVRRFTAKSPLVSAVALDPKGKASSALRVNQLPAAVVVNPDNTVRAIHLGEAKQVQSELAKTLDALLAEPDRTARRQER